MSDLFLSLSVVTREEVKDGGREKEIERERKAEREREWGAESSAVAEFGQEEGHAEEEPDEEQVGAEGQQREGVEQCRVQPEVPHGQHATQVLLGHPLPRPNAAEERRCTGSQGGGEGEGGQRGGGERRRGNQERQKIG